MGLKTLIWSLTLISISSVTLQGCLTTETDLGATKLRQLEQTVEDVECDVFNAITYPDYAPYNGEEFDFIVVGGGTAGCVVASRLSENPACRVLVLEAGGDPDATTEFLSLGSQLVGSPLDWKYKAEPDPRYCLAQKGQRCLLPRGKVLGGSSSINGAVYVRGSPEVFDTWEREGCYGWGYQSLQPYFKKSEDLRSDLVRSDRNYRYYHGIGGYLPVDTLHLDCEVQSFYQNVSQGYKELGYGTYNDINAQYHVGLFRQQATIKGGRRYSSAKAFLKPAELRSNLKISKCSLATRVLFSDNKTANGVTFEKAGVSITVRTRKEVILSAGVINSPQLLMLSGVGPRDHLEELGICVVSDLPVGYNLHDHFSTRGFFVKMNISISKADDDVGILANVFQDKTGIYPSGGSFAAGFIKTSKAPYPDIQFYLQVIAPNTSDGLITQQSGDYGYDDSYTDAVLALNQEGSFFSIYHNLVYPQSRGRLLLRSSNLKEYPLIYPNCLSDKDDIRALLEAFQFTNRFLNTDAMKKVGAQAVRLDIPGCRPYAFLSVDYLLCLMRYSGALDYHTGGTCRMGPRGSSLSVVDPTLQVIGVNGLRVVDASIFPTVPNGNIMAPIIGSAEKASDLIKSSWK